MHFIAMPFPFRQLNKKGLGYPEVRVRFDDAIDLLIPALGYNSREELENNPETQSFFDRYEGCSFAQFLHLFLNPRSDFYRIFFRSCDHPKIINNIKVMIRSLEQLTVEDGSKIVYPFFKSQPIIQALQAIMDVYPDQAFECHVRQLIERAVNPEMAVNQSGSLPSSSINTLPEEPKIPEALLNDLDRILSVAAEEGLDPMIKIDRGFK